MNHDIGSYTVTQPVWTAVTQVHRLLRGTGLNSKFLILSRMLHTYELVDIVDQRLRLVDLAKHVPNAQVLADAYLVLEELG